MLVSGPVLDEVVLVTVEVGFEIEDVDVEGSLDFVCEVAEACAPSELVGAVPEGTVV